LSYEGRTRMRLNSTMTRPFLHDFEAHSASEHSESPI